MSKENDIKVKKVLSFFKNYGLPNDASLMNYFIKKFANENPDDLIMSYKDMPNEEIGDFMEAVNTASKDIDEMESYADDGYDEDIEAAMSHMRNLNKSIKIGDEQGLSVTIGDIIDAMDIDIAEAS